MFNFRKISIDRVVGKITELGTLSLVLIVAIGRIGPLFQTRLLTKFTGPLGVFAGFVIAAIHKFGTEKLFNTVLDQLKKQGKTEEQILEDINTYPIPEWLKLEVRNYIENVDIETVESDDLSNRNEEIISIIQQSIGDDFEQFEIKTNENIDNLESQFAQFESHLNDRIERSEKDLKRFKIKTNENIDNLESQFAQLESRLNDRIDRSEKDLKQFITITVAAGVVSTIGVVALLVSVF